MAVKEKMKITRRDDMQYYNFQVFIFMKTCRNHKSGDKRMFGKRKKVIFEIQLPLNCDDSFCKFS